MGDGRILPNDSLEVQLKDQCSGRWANTVFSTTAARASQQGAISGNLDEVLTTCLVIMNKGSPVGKNE